MKPIIQKLPLPEGSSFIAKTYETPLFETPWHQHEAIELVLQLCEGSFFIGDYIGEFLNGDVFLLGKNLPHWFKKKEDNKKGKAIVIQFDENIFGLDFMNLPEIAKIKSLIYTSKRGLRITGELKKQIKRKITILENLKGFDQLNTLLLCLNTISTSKEFEILTNNIYEAYTDGEQNRISKVYEYSFENFKEPILLEDVAKITNQSISNFCRFFKKNTKKTYIQFLNEIRINYACKLLKETDKSITQICYESGFRNWSNFSSQFKKVIKLSPGVYRENQLIE